jgi:3-hydroxyacyl-CoA dehydrogenase
MAIIAIVGAGLIGRAWAITFARGGHEVRIYDDATGAASSAVQFAAGVIPALAAEDLLDGQAPSDVVGRLRPVQDLAAAVSGAGHVQENTPEDLETKQRVFATLDRLAAPDAVLASSSSALLPSRFTEQLAGRARCLVAHPINPPYLIPAVEIVPAPWTSAEVVERTRALMSAAGQTPIVMKREIDGFVMNRLQGALLEAGVPAGRGRIRIGRGRRYRAARGAGAALVLHGTLRNHRPQRAGRRPRLCAALSADLFPALPLHAAAGRLGGGGAGYGRARPARATA